jgi:hypothetical protein
VNACDVGRTASDEMMPTFVVCHELRGSGVAGELRGAFSTCWVVAADLDEARRIAEAELVQAGWRVLATLDEHEATRETVSEASMQYFEQAQIDGIVIVLDAFPTGAADG